MHAEQVERALAPWRQAHQRLAHAIAGALVTVAIEVQAVDQVDFARHQRRQRVQGILPTLQVAVTFLHLGVELRLQAL
ncbi:hypothetical protein D3C79_1077950 [compost metagenome]